MSRQVLLLTIGAGPLPETTPIVPVDTTPTVDGHTADPLPPPTGMVTAPVFDSVQVAWIASTVEGCSYVVETATDSAGTPGTYSAFAATPNLHYTVPLQGKRWIRVRATLNGRTSNPTAAVLCEAVSSDDLASSAEAIEDLETRVTAVEGVNTAQATSITNLNASVAGKTTTFAQAYAPSSVGRVTGDIWIDTFYPNNYKLYVWNGSSWGLQAIGNKTYYQINAPSSPMPGDVWFDSDDNNKQYRWNGTDWVPVDDARIAAAASAISALDTRVTAAEGVNTSQATSITNLNAAVAGKTTTFAQTSAPTTSGRTVGDLWIDTDDSNKLYTWDGSAWTTRTLPVGAKTYYQTSPPTGTLQTGDLWFDSDDGNKQYRYNGSSWVLVDDARIAAQASAITALETRVTATETTNTSQATSITNLNAAVGAKTTTFAQTSAPSTSGRVVGDLWIDTDDSNKLYTWDGSAWTVRAIPSYNKTWYQTTAPASGMATGDLWFDSDDNNRPYRYNGSSWVEVTDPRTAATATAVSSLEARVTVVEGDYGVNLLRNAGLAIDAKGWTAQTWNQAGDANWLYGRDDLGTSYQVTGTHNFGMHNTGTPAASNNFAAMFEMIPAEVGAVYIFSAWLAAANLSVCDLRLYYYDAAFTYITEHNTNPVGGGYTGGTNIANWQRQYSTSTAPAGAVWMRIGLRAYTSGAASPRAHMMRPMIERAAPGQTTPSAFNLGSSASWAEWNITFDVNGYISGISVASDGRSTAFAVAADIFEVRAPSGTDALTWSAGVLSSRKGSKELKLGPGFGADPSGKKMILSYGAPVADASATRAAADVWIAENGDTKFGGFQLNYGSAWKSGAAITYSAAAGTPATATISVTAGVFAIGSREYSYAASSANVTGTNGTSVVYYLYYDDPGLLAGTCTLYASTDPKVTYTSDTKVLVGQVSVTYPASGSGSGGGSTPGGGGGGGGGGSYCVQEHVLVLRRDASGAPEVVAANTCHVGDFLLLRSMRWGRITCAQRQPANLVRLHGADGGTLTCSEDAPIGTHGGGVVEAARALDHTADCLRALRTGGNYIGTVETRGAGWVMAFTVENDFFWAGDTADCFFAHHNFKFDPP